MDETTHGADQAVMVYMTASDLDEAGRIGKALVDKGLAACVNVLGPIRSLYRWDGEVQDDAEVAFIAKTTAERLEELTAEVNRLHSYDLPCVVALPLVGGSAAFLAWIAAQTQP